MKAVEAFDRSNTIYSIDLGLLKLGSIRSKTGLNYRKLKDSFDKLNS